MRVALNSADFASVALNSATFYPFIHPSTVFFLISVASNSAFFFTCASVHVHNSQHVWLMFDTESQLFLTHGQSVAWTATTEARSEDCGYRQEALLEHGLGAEGHPQSAQRCIKTLISS